MIPEITGAAAVTTDCNRAAKAEGTLVAVAAVVFIATSEPAAISSTIAGAITIVVIMEWTTVAATAILLILVGTCAI